MTHKKFIEKLVDKLQWDESKTSEVIEVILNVLTEQLSDNQELLIESFGVFSTYKNQEYILHNHETGESYLMPPEVVVLFEPQLDEFSEHIHKIMFESDDLLKNTINSAFQNFEPTLINEGVEFPGIKVITNNKPESEFTEVESEKIIMAEPLMNDEVDVNHVAKAELELESEVNPEHLTVAETIQNSESHTKSSLQSDKSLRDKSRSRKSSEVLIPILGGVVIVVATLFFFNGVAKRKNSCNK